MDGAQQPPSWHEFHAATFYYQATANVADVGHALDDPIYVARNYRVSSREALRSEHGLPGRSLADCLAERRSVRRFASDHVDASVVDSLVASAVVGPSEAVMRFRPAPSAGGCFPVECYILCWRIANWNPGLRHLYIPTTGHHPPQWEVLPYAPRPETVEAAMGSGIGGAAAAFVLTATFDKARSKYGDRSYRFALLEGGHLAQNILLGLTCLRLGGYPHGGFADRPLRRCLGLLQPDEWPLYVIPFGVAE